MPTPEQVHAAVNALNRVRAVEKPAEADGSREIWHQAALGVDLFSVVDREGKLAQQELVLYQDVIHWSVRGGLRTGHAADPTASVGRGGDGTWFDPTPSAPCVQRVHAALSGYTGHDKYLLHLRELLTAAVESRPWPELRVISKESDSQPNPMPPVAEPAVPWRLLALAALAAGVAIGGVAAWVWLR